MRIRIRTTREQGATLIGVTFDRACANNIAHLLKRGWHSRRGVEEFRTQRDIQVAHRYVRGRKLHTISATPRSHLSKAPTRVLVRCIRKPATHRLIACTQGQRARHSSHSAKTKYPRHVAISQLRDVRRSRVTTVALSRGRGVKRSRSSARHLNLSSLPSARMTSSFAAVLRSDFACLPPNRTHFSTLSVTHVAPHTAGMSEPFLHPSEGTTFAAPRSQRRPALPTRRWNVGYMPTACTTKVALRTHDHARKKHCIVRRPVAIHYHDIDIRFQSPHPSARSRQKQQW